MKLTAQYVKNRINELCDKLVADCRGEDVCVIGIKNKGAFVAQNVKAELEKMLNKPVLCGQIAISNYRDDLGYPGKETKIYDTEIGFEVTGKTVVLCDDVIMTGRSVRAALEALLEEGRPEKIKLFVVADKGIAFRQMPIHPDYTAVTLNLDEDDFIEIDFD